jgi:uncharacterized protein
MDELDLYLFLQYILLLFLFAKDKNDGGKILFKQQPWTSSHVVFIVISIHIFFGLLFLVNYSLKGNLYSLTKPYYNYFSIFFLTLLLILVLRSKQQGIKTFGFRKDNLNYSIFIGIGIAFLGFGVYIALYLLKKHIDPGFKPFDPSTLEEYFNGYFSIIVFFIVRVIWGPIVEECIFRGIIYSPFRKKYGPKMAILLTATLWTLGHFDLAGAHIVVGILWGMLYEKTESIVSPIVAHSTNNLFGALAEIYFCKYLVL